VDETNGVHLAGQAKSSLVKVSQGQSSLMQPNQGVLEREIIFPESWQSDPLRPITVINAYLRLLTPINGLSPEKKIVYFL
jgi:hypothetical protein